jgi:hypothetical protein
LPLLAALMRGAFVGLTRRPEHQSADEVVRVSQLADEIVEPEAGASEPTWSDSAR